MADKLLVDPKDAKENGTIAVLAYLWVLVLIPILFAKRSTFARFHANQGLILLIIWIVVATLLYILSAPLVNFKLLWIDGIINAGLFVFVVLGIVNVIRGEARELPIIGKYSILK